MTRRPLGLAYCVSLKFSAAEKRKRALAPQLSEHLAEVFDELGLDQSEIDALEAEGII